jgi:hypothetical protein
VSRKLRLEDRRRGGPGAGSQMRGWLASGVLCTRAMGGAMFALALFNLHEDNQPLCFQPASRKVWRPLRPEVGEIQGSGFRMGCGLQAEAARAQGAPRGEAWPRSPREMRGELQAPWGGLDREVFLSTQAVLQPGPLSTSCGTARDQTEP